MFELFLISIILHYAIVVIIVIDWLKYKNFPRVLNVLFFTSVAATYLGVCYVVTDLLGFNTIEKVLTAVVGYALANILIPTGRK